VIASTAANLGEVMAPVASSLPGPCDRPLSRYSALRPAPLPVKVGAPRTARFTSVHRVPCRDPGDTSAVFPASWRFGRNWPRRVGHEAASPTQLLRRLRLSPERNNRLGRNGNEIRAGSASSAKSIGDGRCAAQPKPSGEQPLDLPRCQTTSGAISNQME